MTTGEYAVKAPKKLIEVALPLEAINQEAARRKRKAPAGYPTTIHAWWAQRPVAAARAVVLSQLINDPESLWRIENPTEEPSQQQRGGFTQRRNYLFRLITEACLWDSTKKGDVWARVRTEIMDSWREVCRLNSGHPEHSKLFDPKRPPALCDPFAGGGTIPLEGQRLGLDVVASDLNPVSVLINVGLVDVPRRFAGHPPASSSREKRPRALGRDGGTGLAEDVRRYGEEIRKQAYAQLGKVYPNVLVTPSLSSQNPELKSLAGKELSVVAWLWARTVQCPSPRCGRHTPLLTSAVLSTGPKKIYLDVSIESGQLHFTVGTNEPKSFARPAEGLKRGMSGTFECVFCGAVTERDYVAEAGKSKRFGVVQTAAVLSDGRKRIYVAPDVSRAPRIDLEPDRTGLETPLAPNPRDVWCRNFGLETAADLFTDRQLLSLTVISDLISRVPDRIAKDAVSAGFAADEAGLERGGRGAKAYGEAIALYLTFALSRVADYGSSIATWRTKDNAMRSTLGKHTIPMSWDFAEASPFGGSSGGFEESVDVVARALDFLPDAAGGGSVRQMDARDLDLGPCVISTDPPYYNNVAYADLADFFYPWMRRTLRAIFPELLASISTPKGEELVAAPHRHGSRQGADAYFLTGMTSAMKAIARNAHPAVPVTIYYAHKQSETKAESGTYSSGWETFLEALLRAGFAVVGTWPLRTEGDNRQIGNDRNALASSVLLVCRPRRDDAPIVSRRHFVRELSEVLPAALNLMTAGADTAVSPIGAVDLSQAIVGPGMAVFSKYGAVLEADGSRMNVRSALQLINRFVSEADFDGDTQFCLHWFEEHGWDEGAYGEAENLGRAKATSVEGLRDAGVLFAGGGKVRLRKWAEYPVDWDPRKDDRLPVWEALHQLIRALKTHGEAGAGKVLRGVREKADAARQLAYRLYTLCERKGWAEDARAYNELVTSWAAIEAAAGDEPPPTEPQMKLFGGDA